MATSLQIGRASPRSGLLCALISLALAACQSKPQPVILQPASIDRLRSSIEYLASDELEGRGPGSAGLDAAAEHVATSFRSLGLRRPPGQRSWLQPFSVNAACAVDPSSTFKINGRLCSLGEFAPCGFSPEVSFEGPVVFAGFGIAGATEISGRKYDDYVSIDVRGKVVLMIMYGPCDSQGNSRLSEKEYREHAMPKERIQAAADRGAIAVLCVPPAGFDEPQYQPRLRFPPFGMEPCAIPVIQLRRSLTDDLLKQANAPDLRSLQMILNSVFRPTISLKGVHVEGNVALQRTTYNCRNVVAYLPGRGPRSKEVIVVAAHYDHITAASDAPASTTAPTTRAVCHGADDNASGVAAMLELARIFSQAGPLDRSILFVAFSAEEIGLLGSEHFLKHSPVPLNRIVAMVNLDMVGRIREENLQVSGSATASAFATLLRDADDASPLRITTFCEDGSAASDQISFVARRIPSLYFHSGMHEDVHATTDTAAKINYAGEAEIVNLVARFIVAVSRQPDLKFIAATTQPVNTTRHAP